MPTLVTQSDWDSDVIQTGCTGSAGTRRFYCDVNHQSAGIENPGEGNLDVTWNPPNSYQITFGAGYQVPHNGHDNDCIDVTICLKWDGTLIGDCALVCTGEEVEFTSSHPSTAMMNGTGVSAWFPNCTTPASSYSTNGAPSVFPNDTWIWDSPCLTDVNVTGGVDVSNIPVGTFLGFTNRRYRFRGPYCDGTKWTLLTPVLKWNLVVQVVDGTKMAIYEVG
jgi:hypothetical protein